MCDCSSLALVVQIHPAHPFHREDRILGVYYGLKIRRLWFDPTSSHQFDNGAVQVFDGAISQRRSTMPGGVNSKTSKRQRLQNGCLSLPKKPDARWGLSREFIVWHVHWVWFPHPMEHYNGDSRLSSDSYYDERLNDIGNCCRKRPTGLFRTGVRFPSAPPISTPKLMVAANRFEGDYFV